MIEFKKWLALKATRLLIASLAMLLSHITQAEAVVVKDLRIGSNNETVRMVLELDRPLTSPPSVSISGDTVKIALTGITNDLSPPGTESYHDDIMHLNVSKVSDETRIEAAFSFAPADVKAFSIIGPHRFIIDIYRPLTSPTEPVRQTPAFEKNSSLPESNHNPDGSVPPGGSGSVAEASMKHLKPGYIAPPDAAEIKRNQFQQRLIAALIGLTSVIIVLLFFLIRTGDGRKKLQEPSWTNHLPPTKDPNIQNIDAMIRKHLRNYYH